MDIPYSICSMTDAEALEEAKEKANSLITERVDASSLRDLYNARIQERRKIEEETKKHARIIFYHRNLEENIRAREIISDLPTKLQEAALNGKNLVEVMKLQDNRLGDIYADYVVDGEWREESDARRFYQFPPTISDLRVCARLVWDWCVEQKLNPVVSPSSPVFPTQPENYYDPVYPFSVVVDMEKL